MWETGAAYDECVLSVQRHFDAFLISIHWLMYMLLMYRVLHAVLCGGGTTLRGLAASVFRRRRWCCCCGFARSGRAPRKATSPAPLPSVSFPSSPSSSSWARCVTAPWRNAVCDDARGGEDGDDGSPRWQAARQHHRPDINQQDDHGKMPRIALPLSLAWPHWVLVPAPGPPPPTTSPAAASSTATVLSSASSSLSSPSSGDTLPLQTTPAEGAMTLPTAALETARIVALP
jgi:hypothetical protein